MKSYQPNILIEKKLDYENESEKVEVETAPVAQPAPPPVTPVQVIRTSLPNRRVGVVKKEIEVITEEDQDRS